MVEPRGMNLSNSSNFLAAQPTTSTGIDNQGIIGGLANPDMSDGLYILSGKTSIRDLARLHAAVRQIARAVARGHLTMKRADACVLAMALQAERDGLVPRDAWLPFARSLAALTRETFRKLDWWGAANAEFSARIEASRRAHLATRRAAPPDTPRRRLSRLAVRLLRSGCSGRELLAELDAANAALPAPLDADAVGSVALWASGAVRETRHGAR